MTFGALIARLKTNLLDCIHPDGKNLEFKAKLTLEVINRIIASFQTVISLS
jgi:hypothetical protein